MRQMNKRTFPTQSRTRRSVEFGRTVVHNESNVSFVAHPWGCHVDWVHGVDFVEKKTKIATIQLLRACIPDKRNESSIRLPSKSVAPNTKMIASHRANPLDPGAITHPKLDIAIHPIDSKKKVPVPVPFPTSLFQLLPWRPTTRRFFRRNQLILEFRSIRGRKSKFSMSYIQVQIMTFPDVSRTFGH